MIGVAIAAQSELERAGLSSLVAGPGIRVVAAFRNWEEVAHAEGIDVLVTTEAPDELIESIGELPAVVLLADVPMPGALRAGVRGVLPRSSAGADIRAALEAVHAGWTVLAPQDVPALLSAGYRAANPTPLTSREVDVLRMLSEGLSNKEIAWRLHISEHTVKFHVNSILTKLGAGSRTEAVMLGLRQGLVLL